MPPGSPVRLNTNGRNPVDIGLHRLARDGVWKVLLDREGRNGNARGQQMIVFVEQLAVLTAEIGAVRLGGRDLLRRHLEARANVVGDVRAQPILLVEPRVHVRDEPQSAQRQERRPRGR
jgi:hypothetical protein